ncbi:cystatin domain-containing protein [Vibrio paucivorans]
MNKTLLITTTFMIVSLSGCSPDSPQQVEKKPSENPMCISQETLAGGWAQSVVTPEAELALDTVLAQMNTDAKLEEIISVRTQVVNGINYAIEFKLESGEVWHTIVYRSIEGKYQMTQVATQGRFCQ